MWSVEDPGMMTGHAETSLMGPSIWTQGNAQQQWQQAAGPAQGWQQSLPPPHSQYAGFPPSQPQLKNAWDRPAPGPPAQAPSQWGAPPQGAPAPPTPTGWSAQPAPPPAPTGNWGMPPPNAPQQQWGGGNAMQAGSGPSYSEAAKKNVPFTPVPPAAVRNQRPFDAGWGQPRVDQGTPWDGGRGQPPPNDMMKHAAGSDQWQRPDGTGHWGEPTAGHAQPVQQQHANTASWGQPPPPAAPPASNGWGNPPPQGPPVQAPPVQPADNSGWGQAPPPRPNETNWGQQHQQPPEQHDARGGRGGGQWGQEASNPQHPSMWVPPAPQGNPPSWGGGMSSGAGHSFNYQPTVENRDDMVWHDPNPKTKKVLMDKGTGVWGDPSSQGVQEIKRWKNMSPEDVALASQLALAAQTANNSPQSANPTESQTNELSAANATSTGLWDSTPAATPASGKASTPGWGDSTPITSTAAATTGWGNPTNTASTEPTGWNTQTNNAINANKVDNVPPTSDANNFQNVNSGGAGSMPVNMPNLLGLANANTTNNSDLQRLTQQIGSPPAQNSLTIVADHLRVAVTKGLININILSQPLPQQTLLLLNQLLQRVPKLEAATLELANLRRTVGNAQPNPSQQQEQNRLLQEITTLQRQVKEYQAQINQQTGAPPVQQAASGGSTPADTPSQSRLMTAWKNGANCSSEGESRGMESVTDSLASMAVGNGDSWKNQGDANSDKSGDGSDSTKQNNEDGLVRGLLAPTDRTSITPSQDEDTGSQNGRNREFKEFIPGTKFEWEDPNDVAKDPNATPGSLKPNPLSVGSNMDRIGGGGSLSFPATFAHRPSNLTGAITPTKMGFEPRQQTTNFSPSSDWRGRPPSSMGQPMGQGMGQAPGPQRTNFRSMSSPGQNNSAFAPYPTNNMWILLSNVVDVEGLRVRLRQIGAGSLPVLAPPGAQFALLKCEMGADKLVPRLHQELMHMNISVSVPSPAELERLTIAANHPQRAMPPFIPPGPGGPAWPTGGNEMPAAGGWGAPPQGDFMAPPPWGEMNGDGGGY